MFDLAPEEDSPVSAAAARRGGPRTPEGKARSSRNAVRHGLNCAPSWDAAEAEENRLRAEEFAAGEPRLALEAQAAAEAWAWLQRVRAVSRARLQAWTDIAMQACAADDTDPEAVRRDTEAGARLWREVQAISRYENRARKAMRDRFEELDAARLGLVRAHRPPTSSADDRPERDELDDQEPRAWWDEDDPGRAVDRYLAECGFAVSRDRAWLGRDWVWESDEAKRTAAQRWRAGLAHAAAAMSAGKVGTYSTFVGADGRPDREPKVVSVPSFQSSETNRPITRAPTAQNERRRIRATLRTKRTQQRPLHERSQQTPSARTNPTSPGSGDTRHFRLCDPAGRPPRRKWSVSHFPTEQTAQDPGVTPISTRCRRTDGPEKKQIPRTEPFSPKCWRKPNRIQALRRF